MNTQFKKNLFRVTFGLCYVSGHLWIYDILRHTENLSDRIAIIPFIPILTIFGSFISTLKIILWGAIGSLIFQIWIIQTYVDASQPEAAIWLIKFHTVLTAIALGGRYLFQNQRLQTRLKLKSAENSIRQDIASQLSTASRLSLIGEISANIVHEIKNPLSAIRTMGQMINNALKTENYDPILMKQISERMLKNIDRINRIVENMQKMSQGFGRDPFAPNDLGTIILNAIDLIRDKALEEDVAILVPHPVKFFIECREIEIMQTLVNLLSNSIDAVKSKSDRWIKIEGRLDNGDATIRVIDSGRGIPEIIRQKIMQPFFTTKESGKGTGLGLNMSKRLIEEHGRNFSIDHKAPNTTFVIRLPIIQNHSSHHSKNSVA